MRLTETRFHIDRRCLLAGAGAGLLSLMSARQAEALGRSEATFVSTAQEPNGQYCVVVLGERGEKIASIALPARGHDVTFDPVSGRVIVFARRPGTFAVLFAPRRESKPQVIKSAANRHFFGHGVFSADGRLVYATENDFENGRGVIGLYDVSAAPVKRIGEFPSHGVGPHEILPLKDGKTLVVANGGIETHPDYGRAKLNLGSMKPSLVFIDRESGDLLETHELPQSLHQLSIRHMAVREDDKIWFGCQHQGSKTETPPLVGSIQRGEALKLLSPAPGHFRLMKNYVGSLMISRDGETLATSSPHGDVVIYWNAETGRHISTARLADGCGIAPDKDGFLLSNGKGELVYSDKRDFSKLSDVAALKLRWDNHMLPISG